MTTNMATLTKLDRTLSLAPHRQALQTIGQILLLATSVGLLTSFALITLIWHMGL